MPNEPFGATVRRRSDCAVLQREWHSPSPNPQITAQANPKGWHTARTSPSGIPDNPEHVLLNDQATVRLIDDDLLKMAWPPGLGFCPKVDHDAHGATACRGSSRDPEPRARPDRTRSRTAHHPTHLRFSLCGTSAAVVVAARGRQGVKQRFQLGAKAPREYK